YEQVRSVVAALAGNLAAADDVRLELPETGVCSASFPPTGSVATETGCCGGPAPAESDGCCVADVVAKTAGESGCGCGSPQVTKVPLKIPVKSACCAV